jgi:hypothetical protein
MAALRFVSIGDEALRQTLVSQQTPPRRGVKARAKPDRVAARSGLEAAAGRGDTGESGCAPSPLSTFPAPHGIPWP